MSIVNNNDANVNVQAILARFEKQKQYIKNYQSSEAGKLKVKEATTRYYQKNKDKIKQKKKEKYHVNKQSSKLPVIDTADTDSIISSTN
jgi:hypothetical protein